MIRHNHCPLCLSKKISLYLKCTDHLVSREEFELYRCTQCGFIFTHEYPDEQEIGRYYDSENYISHDDRAKGFTNRVYLGVRDIMLQRKLRIVEIASGLFRGNILDIGCGTGYFAGTMKEAGWVVTGIEPNEKARDFAVSRFGIKVLSPDRKTDLSDKSFDCITMWHVMEHFHDPFKYSDEISRLLGTDGICIIALPNSDSSDAQYYGSHWAAYDVPRHLWHFNPSTFRLFWEKKGFEIIRIKCLPFDVFYISILSEKNKESKIPFIKGLLTGSMFALKSALNKNKYSSLIYFLRKK
jgi:SAM-dependent methyltransferase